jgi:hypothetical protein
MQFIDNFMTSQDRRFLKLCRSSVEQGWRDMKVWNNLAMIAVTASILAMTPQTIHATDKSSVVFTGEIMDSLCAKDGSHDKMMDEMKSMGRDKQTCAQKCVQLGAKYVLFDAEKRTIYALDDQDKAASFAGQKVRVKGSLDKKKIKVSSIEPAS